VCTHTYTQSENVKYVVNYWL